MGKKKVNPQRRSASAADVERAKKQATDFAIESVWAIFFTALRDKEGFEEKRLRRVWDSCQNLSDSIVRGYVKVQDLIDVLRDEAEAALKKMEEADN